MTKIKFITMSKQIDIKHEEIKSLMKEYDMSGNYDLYDGVMYEIELIQLQIDAIMDNMVHLISQFSNN